MKVAITCDYLIGNGHYSQVIAAVCELFPSARLFCLAHLKGSVPSVIEQRSITSSHLSKKISSLEDFYSFSYLFPFLARKLFVPCEYGLIINIGQGLSHGLRHCERSRVVSYLYDYDLENKIKKTVLQKLFFSYVSSWSRKSLEQVHELMVSRSELNNSVRCIPLPIQLSQYALFPKSMFAHDYFLIEAQGLTVQKASLLSDWMKSGGHRFKFFGHDLHLAPLKEMWGSELFYGERCAGEHAPVLAGACAFITFNDAEFPQHAFASLAVGRPVVMALSLRKWANGPGTYFCDFDSVSLMRALTEVIASESGLDPRTVRSQVTQSEIKFKLQLSSVLKTQE